MVKHADTSFGKDIKKYLAFALKFGLTVGLLFIIMSHVSAGDVLRHDNQISSTTVAYVAFLLLAHIVISAVRWRMVLGCMDTKISWWPIFSGTLLERVINQAIPSTISGDACRVLSVQRTGIGLSTALISVIFDRALALGGIVLIVALGLPFTFELFPNAAVHNTLAAIVGISAFALLFILTLPSAHLVRLAKVKGLKQITGLVQLTQSLFKRPRFVVMGFGLSMLAQLLLVIAFQRLAVDLQVDLSLPAAIVAVPAINLASLLPVTLAGWGVREGVAVFLLGLIGISAEDALSISILYGLMTLVVSCAGAVMWFLIDLRQPSNK